MHLTVCTWAMFDAAGNDEQLAGSQYDVAVAKLDGQLTVNDEEQLVGVIVTVPDEFALHLHDFDLVVIEAGNDFG